MPASDLPLRAAVETVRAHGIEPDRQDILQDSSTLVVRLTQTLVARVVQDVNGPRQGTAWFARENAMAQHLTEQGAPVIPLHPDLPPGPHMHLGYPMNFWLYVQRVNAEPAPSEIGRTLHQCHAVLRSFQAPLPCLAIVEESLDLLPRLAEQHLLPAEDIELLRRHLATSLKMLAPYPQQPLHGDAHVGNLMNTTQGLLWTDWEDAFAGPAEWDVASIVWNPLILDEDHDTVNCIMDGYRQDGGVIDPQAFAQCLVARAAVVTAWYPLLYPNPNADRQDKMLRRLQWLRTQSH